MRKGDSVTRTTFREPSGATTSRTASLLGVSRMDESLADCSTMVFARCKAALYRVVGQFDFAHRVLVAQALLPVRFFGCQVTPARPRVAAPLKLTHYPLSPSLWLAAIPCILNAQIRH